MDMKLYRDKLANASAGVVILGAISVLLAGALIANGFFRRSEILHVVPVEVTRPYEVGRDAMSPDYLRQMALSLIPHLANVTPASVEVSHEMIRRYLAPESFGHLSEALAQDADYVKRHHLNRVFFPDSVLIEGNRVILLGQEHRFIGHNKVAEESRAYALTLRIRDWKVEILDVGADDAAHYQRRPGPS